MPFLFGGLQKLTGEVSTIDEVNMSSDDDEDMKDDSDSSAAVAAAASTGEGKSPAAVGSGPGEAGVGAAGRGGAVETVGFGGSGVPAREVEEESGRWVLCSLGSLVLRDSCRGRGRMVGRVWLHSLRRSVFSLCLVGGVERKFL